MLLNYLKIAIKVWGRRKFFTFVSLFGISFTLMILMVVAAFADQIFGANYPEKKMDRMLFVLLLKEEYKDNGQSSGPLSYGLLDEFVSKMQTPELMSIQSVFKIVNAYVDNRKLSLYTKSTDSRFWEIYDFEFIEGKPFLEADVEAGNNVIVINEETRKQYFGEKKAVGELMEVDQINYRVTGVVKDVPFNRFTSFADVWVPINKPKELQNSEGYRGTFMATLLVPEDGSEKLVREEFKSLISKLEKPDPEQLLNIYSAADPLDESITRTLMGDSEDSKIEMVYLIIFLAMILFMALPAINLININISRIMERSSEIGVRKSFGATKVNLVWQFIFENILLTLVGCLLGFLFSYLVLIYINNSGLIPYANVQINMSIFFTGTLIAIFFGLLSGVFPAYRMANLQIVDALKGGVI